MRAPPSPAGAGKRIRPRLGGPHAASPAPAVLALQLLGSWNRLANGHVALSAGCSCGVADSQLRVQDFEQDILDFLRVRHPIALRADSIQTLLTDLARHADDHARPMLADLARSLDSFEAQHSGR
jgi:hypothetical protein